MLDVSSSITIRRPRAEVAAYAADPTNAPRWYVNIESVEWRTPPPVRVGCRIDFIARFLGRRLAYTYEVTNYVPGARLVMSTVDGPFPMETTYEWEDDPSGGTAMTLRNRGGPRGVGRLLTPIAALAVRSANRNDLRNLKAVLEAKPTAISAIAPFFIVSDAPSALSFYRDRLGFEIIFKEPDDAPFFGIASRGGAMIMLKDVGVDPVPNWKREPAARWDAYVLVPDPDALAAEFASREVEFSEPLKDTHDGLRGFELRDVDGYVLFFGRPREDNRP